MGRLIEAAAESMLKGTTPTSCDLRDTSHASCFKVRQSILSIIFENLLIQTKHYSDTASESETSNDGSLDNYNHEDPEVVPDEDCEGEEAVALCLSEPPEDASIGRQVVEDFSNVAETEPTRLAPEIVDLEPMRTEGEASVGVFEGEVSARVSDPDPLFIESEPTRTGRRRKCRDMSRLSQCLCGDTAKPNEEGSIQCQKVGCDEEPEVYSRLTDRLNRRCSTLTQLG